METAASSAWLIPVSGPALAPIEIEPVSGGATLGRGETCPIRVPVDADRVSRQHARFLHDDAGWRIVDLSSRWGTFLNGVKLPPHRDVPLGEGDLVRIAPWTFNFTARGVPHHCLRSEDDLTVNATMIRSHTPGQGTEETTANRLAEDMLALLLESAAAIHGAETESTLAETLIDAATRGTGLPNAAVLRPLDADGHLNIIAARNADADGDAPRGYSRSLLTAASEGFVAELQTGADTHVAQSIVRLGINAAICAPLMLGGTVAAYLYVDSRGNSSMARPPRAGAAAFCLALARMSGLALANLKRVDIEKRQAAIEHDLSAAAEAHKWILPPRVVQSGQITCTGESRAGAYVGGDFFDVIPLDDGRVVVALGDVSGHGVAASVLMTAAQGFLHAALRRNESLDQAVTELNRFIVPRRPFSSFMTLWVGIFDAANHTVSYVNAGHGYALIEAPGTEPAMLDGGHDMPVGFDESAEYRAVTQPLPKTGRALIVSDGLIEQYDLGTTCERQQFGLDNVRELFHTTRDDDTVAAIFDAVIKHAGSTALQDDATAVVVTWS